MRFDWQQKDWPNFTYDLAAVESDLLRFTEKSGLLNGLLLALPERLRSEAVVDLMAAEALKSSEIEGELLERSDVKSSIRNHLGLNSRPEIVHDLRAIGFGKLLANARSAFSEPLSEPSLFAWHSDLLSWNPVLAVGKWREHAEPMQIISGAIGRERVHFEAPPSAEVPKMMAEFIDWFNQTQPSPTDSDARKSAIRAAVAHLYFETIHPFEDGNGRIGRAIAEKALSQGLGAPVPFSLSRAIEARKKDYYSALERASRSNDLTDWMAFFIPTIVAAQESAAAEMVFLVKKAAFFDRFGSNLNERQLKIVRRMFEEGPAGFVGGMNPRKHSGITGTSKATATRDLQQLAEMGVFTVSGGGRNTSYFLNL